MDDVILFRPSEVYSKAICTHRPPLGLLYISASLVDRGFSTLIIDTETTEDWLDKLKSALREDTILVGVGVMTGYQISGALEFSKAVKQLTRVPVVWGGLHPSLLPKQTVQHELIDIVVIGEGERTLPDLAEKIKNRSSLDTVANIVFKKDGTIIQTKREKNFLDMNTLTLPDYRLVATEHYANHKREFMDGRKRCLDLNTDRGCPYRCGFCYNLQFNDRRWRGASAEKVLEDVQLLVNYYGVDAVNFTSDNFFVKKERVRTICKGLIEQNINIIWHADMRIDTFLHYEENLLRLMMKSGCRNLTFGVESGSDRILELIQKDIRVEDVLKAHKKALDLGFKVNYHFMIGFPEEKMSDIIETLKLLYLLLRDKNTKVYGPSIYIPYPGTTLFERSVEMGFEPPNNLEDWIKYDWYSTTTLPWFSEKEKRYLSKVQFIAFRAASFPANFIKWMVVKYFRVRLFGIIHGINMPGFDIALARYCVTLARIIKTRNRSASAR